MFVLEVICKQVAIHGRDVSEAVERAGQSTALPRIRQPQLPLQTISQHLSLCRQLLLSSASIATKLLSQRNLEKTLL